MTERRYSNSIAIRMRVLFSPSRAFVFALSLIWFVSLTVVTAATPDLAHWTGPASVVPILWWSLATVMTDWQHRRADQANQKTRKR